MALEYRSERNEQAEKTINRLLKDAPEYVKAFYEHMHGGKREITTQMSYVRDVLNFLKYEKSVLPHLKDLDLKDIPLSLMDELKLQDMNEYRLYLKNEKKIVNASSRKIFSSISAFYQYLNMAEYTMNNPMVNFEFPVTNKKKIIKLNSSLSNKLLNGILANDRYLIESKEHGDRIVPIDETVRIKREKIVLRNYAICCLFLGSGLRVSELVGLDLEDINFYQNSLTVIAKGGDETSVYFGEEVEKALRNYLNGLPLPSEILEKYRYVNEDILEWVKNHISDHNFIERLEAAFSDCDETFKRDLLNLRNAMLRQGRASLRPRKGCNAVFVTTRGTRMSVRSVELMIKEMVKTYLPEYDDKEKFSPHKLRATCATRILTQTGDIALASTQLNHKSIAVTSAFYAELQKELQKEKIKSLDVNKW